MVQVPVAIKEAVVPDTVQAAAVVDTKLTGRPELAVADRAIVPPTGCAGMALNLIV